MLLLQWQNLNLPCSNSKWDKHRAWPLQWRHNGHAYVPNHQPHDCLLNRLFRCRSKKPSKLRFTGLCAGNSPCTGEFLAQMASKAENVWWRHHGLIFKLWTTSYKHLTSSTQQSSFYVHIKGLVQDCSNSIAKTLELLQSCAKSIDIRWQSTEVNKYRWVGARKT